MADPQLHIDKGLSDSDGYHSNVIEVTNDSTIEPDLSDELTVEYLEMVRNWKRADEHKPPEHARDIVEAAPANFNPPYEGRLRDQMKQQIHPRVIKVLNIDDQIHHGV